MTSTAATLYIPGDRSSARIAAPDGSTAYLEGDETAAIRISTCVPPMVGADTYAAATGQLAQKDGLQVFVIRDGAGLGADVEVEFAENRVQRVSVLWSD